MNDVFKQLVEFFLRAISVPPQSGGQSMTNNNQNTSQPPQARTGARTNQHRTRNRKARQRNSSPEAPVFDDLISRTRNAGEEDFRLAILNTLLSTPHRQIARYIELFRYVHDRDPLFFGHLAAWYFDHGTVHDLKQLFIAFMVTSRFTEDYRHAGIALLQKLPPFQVQRVLGMVKGHEEEGRYIAGVSTSVPRSLRTAIEEYLREREKNHEAFDNVVLHARHPLKSLYASLRIKPGEYAQQVLFDNNPPPDSRLYVLKQLARTTDPGEQARLIVENRLPYRVAISGLRRITPSVLVALINAMTPQEVINNLASLKKRGAMDNKEVRSLIDSKLELAKTDKRVSALKTRQAIKAAGLDEEMSRKVEAVGDQQIKTKARIKRSTALHIDKSGSMQVAIEVGKQIAAIIAPICEQDLFVYAFDVIAYPIKAQGKELSHWEKAFKGIQAAGGTACGAALEMMRRNQQRVEQIIMVTDQEENSTPKLMPTLEQYRAELGIAPDVIIVNVGSHSNDLVNQLKRTSIVCDTFTFAGDYYSLPNLLPLLAGGTRLDLLMEIMSYALPDRNRKLVGAQAP